METSIFALKNSLTSPPFIEVRVLRQPGY